MRKPVLNIIGYDDTRIEQSVTNRISRKGINFEAEVAISGKPIVMFRFVAGNPPMPSPFGKPAPDTDESTEDNTDDRS